MIITSEFEINYWTILKNFFNADKISSWRVQESVKQNLKRDFLFRPNLLGYESSSYRVILRYKTYNHSSRWRDRIIDVRTKPYDSVIWNLRIAHSENAIGYKLLTGVDNNSFINNCILFCSKRHMHDEQLFSFPKMCQLIIGNSVRS